VLGVIVVLTALALRDLPSTNGPEGSGATGSPGSSQAIAIGSGSPSFSPGATDSPGPTGTVQPSPTDTSVPTSTPRASVAPSATPKATGTPKPTATTAAGVPAFRHVYLVIMENEEAKGIVGNAKAPYINSLIAKYGLATNYTAVAHPSEPNYIALFSGSTHGVTDDGIYNLAGKNLADQLEAKGRDWRVYEQNLPDAPCFTGGTSTGGPDGPGEYARKHNPAISFTDISGNAARCAKIQNFSHMDLAAADFELIVPNLANDMHDTSVAFGDSYLKGFLPTIINSPAMAGSVLFLTWDEGSSGTGGGGKVATVVIGPGIPAGFTSGTAYTHYSLLRTIQDAWGLGCLASTCSANNMGAFWP
jgi:acid phosphatase